MYLRKMGPRTVCLYSAVSMLLRSLSAASQSLASNPRLAVEWFFEEEPATARHEWEAFLAALKTMSRRKRLSPHQPRADKKADACCKRLEIVLANSPVAPTLLP